MLSDIEKGKLIERYVDRFRKYGVDVRTLNSGDDQKQRIRHSVHSSIGELNNRTVLDIGCGLADYYRFLLSKGIEVTYIGYDIVEPFIEINRQRFPEAHFEVRDIFTEKIAHAADYICMSQVFNNRYESVNNEEVAKRAIALAFEAVTIGVSIDMMTKYVDYEENALYYFSPERMFEYAKSLTRFAMLRHDYLPFEFALFLYRGPTLP